MRLEKVRLPVNLLVSVPPRKSSPPLSRRVNPKIDWVVWPSETNVWNTGGALKSEMDWNAMPIKPSGGETSSANPDEYCDAAPTRCFVAVRPAMVTVSVNCSPETVEPSPKASEKVLRWSTAVLLAAVL